MVECSGLLLRSRPTLWGDILWDGRRAPRDSTECYRSGSPVGVSVDQACCQVAPDACQAYDKRRRSVFVYWVFLISDDGDGSSPTLHR